MSNMYINEPRTSGKVCLNTTLGDIDIELWSKECPLAARNFIQLCMEGYYDGTIFHRLQKDFMVQGGDPTGTGESNDSIYGEPFKSEFHQRLQFNRRGLLGCAGDKDSNGSQFFFTLGSTPELYKKHTMFGKVTGNTVFNLMRFNEHDIDKNDRPVPEQKILKVKILENPFKDIKPRERAETKKSEKSKEKKEKKKPTTVAKNTALLSFGDEVEEDEAELAQINKDLSKKGKSAHDVLNDQKLSKSAAINPEEFSNYEKPEQSDDEDDDKKDERINKIREKLKKRKLVEKKDENMDDNFEDAMAAEKKRRIDEEKQKLTEQLNELQKEYAKSLRGPKAQNDDDDEPQSEAIRNYSNMKLKFKKDMKGIVKQADPSREAQTMQMFEMIKSKIAKPKEVPTAEVKEEEPLPPEILEAAAGNKAVIEENAEDEVGETWMAKKFHAPEDTSGITKARDANMKDQDEEWYPIGDPRNKMAQRRRDGALDEV